MNQLLDILYDSYGWLDRRDLDVYWQHGVEQLCEKLSAGVSLSLLDHFTGAPEEPWRAGVLSAEVEARVTEWEANLAYGNGERCTGVSADEQSNSLTAEDVAARFIYVQMVDDQQLVHICLVVDGIARGGLTLAVPVAQELTRDDQLSLYRFLQLFGGSALRAYYLQLTRERLERINLLYQSTQAVSNSLNLTTVLHEATELAVHVLSAEAATLFRVDEERGSLGFLITKGAAAEVLEEQRLPLDQGVVGWVAKRHKSLIVDDVRNSELFDPSTDTQTGFQTRNILCVPLRNQDRTVGVIEVLNKKGGDFTADDTEWLEMMGQHIAIALDNAQLYTREREKVRELAMLNEVSQAINSELDVNGVLDLITESVLEILPVEHSEFWLVGPQHRDLYIGSSAGMATGSRGVRTLPIGVGLAGWCAQHNRSLMVNHVDSDPRHVAGSVRAELEQSSCALVPITHRGKVFGVLAVYSLRGVPFISEEQALLETFANQVAVALRNAELYQDLRAEQERIIRAQEEVRHQLARELHDNTAQMLSLIIMNLDLMRQLIQSDRVEQVVADLSMTEELARRANREVRTLLFELRPIILESRGLIPALNSYSRQLADSMESQIHLEAGTLPFELTLQAASALFSIMQEAVNNIRKHAQAKNVWLRVHANSNTLTFEVEDDGVGFNYRATIEDYDYNGSFGLLNMRERAELLGGGVEILSPRPNEQGGTLLRGSVDRQAIDVALQHEETNLFSILN